MLASVRAAEGSGGAIGVAVSRTVHITVFRAVHIIVARTVHVPVAIAIHVHVARTVLDAASVAIVLQEPSVAVAGTEAVSVAVIAWACRDAG